MLTNKHPQKSIDNNGCGGDGGKGVEEASRESTEKGGAS